MEGDVPVWSLVFLHQDQGAGVQVTDWITLTITSWMWYKKHLQVWAKPDRHGLKERPLHLTQKFSWFLTSQVRINFPFAERIWGEIWGWEARSALFHASCLLGSDPGEKYRELWPAKHGHGLRFSVTDGFSDSCNNQHLLSLHADRMNLGLF